MNEPRNSASDSPAALAPVYQSAITVLTRGFRTGAALLVAGLVVAIARRESLNDKVDPFGEIIPAILDGKAAGLIDLAILAIMITPLLTVIVVATGFFRAGDRRYGFFSVVVLAVLCVSVALSLLR